MLQGCLAHKTHPTCLGRDAAVRVSKAVAAATVDALQGCLAHKNPPRNVGRHPLPVGISALQGYLADKKTPTP